MKKLDNPSTLAPNDIVVARFVDEYNTCQRCQGGIKELEELKKQNKVGEIIILEVKDDWETIEKIEEKLRAIAKIWTDFSYILCGYFQSHLKSEKRWRADKEKGIGFLIGYDTTIEGRPVSDFE